MAEIIEMPKLSDTMSVGTIVSWLKKEGEPVASGDMIAEIETDKATMEMEVFTDGVLLKQYVKAGGQVAVGEPIAAIGEKGEKVPEATASAAPAEKPAEAPKEEAPAPAPAAEEAKPAEPAAPAPAPAPVSAFDTASTDHVKASPLAKKLAKEKGIDLSKISGTGPNGRIVKADVLNAGDAHKISEAPAQAASASAPAPAAPAIPAGETLSIPVSNMRGVIAKRLLESKTTIPHFYLDIEVDMTALLEMRKSVNSRLADQGMKLSVNDFILKAATEALRKVPAANASWKETTIEQHGDVHMAFAVAVEDGLVTPTIKNAHAKSLRQLSVEAKELIQKAQNKKLTPDEMSGSTFTVTNLGMFGINSFYGIINPPNAAILSVGATKRIPVVNEKGEIVPGDRMHIGISGDHRVVDGAMAAQYLSTVKGYLESPATMLV